MLQVEDDGVTARDDTIDRLRGSFEFCARRLAQRAVHAQDDDDAEGRSRDYQRVVRSLLHAQRAELVRVRDTGESGADALRSVQEELDLEEMRLDS